MTGQGTKAKILVIDDERTVADTLKTIFSKAGMEAMAVYSAEQALTLMSQWVPQMAIIDVQLPGMNGIDLAILLKDKYPDCGLTLFSGYAATNDLLEKAKREWPLPRGGCQARASGRSAQNGPLSTRRCRERRAPGNSVRFSGEPALGISCCHRPCC